jgi:hypothetical protein
MVGGKDFIEVRGTTSDKSLPLYFPVTVSVTCYLQVSPENCQPFPRTVTPPSFSRIADSCFFSCVSRESRTAVRWQSPSHAP